MDADASSLFLSINKSVSTSKISVDKAEIMFHQIPGSSLMQSGGKINLIITEINKESKVISCGY